MEEQDKGWGVGGSVAYSAALGLSNEDGARRFWDIARAIDWSEMRGKGRYGSPWEQACFFV